MTYNQSEVWSETALVGITPIGAGNAEVQFAALTETIDIDEGEKGMEQIANMKGGRLVKKNPQEPTTVTFEAYPTGIYGGGMTEDNQLGPSQYFHDTQTNWDTSSPYQVDTSRNRDLFRVAILWTDASVTVAGGTVGAGDQVGQNAYRWVGANGYMTSCKKSYTDGVLKFTFSFWFPPFDADGTGNIIEESIDKADLATLTSLTGYASGVRGW